ncbi:MAG: Ig-like domain-containing protein [Gemmatimonadota bacterium]
MTVLVATSGLLVSAAGCAKEEPPPGALPDQRPPGVREIVPASGSVVPEFDDWLKVRFDEPIQQPGGGYARGLVASPADRYEVTSTFSELRVRPEGGWRSGAVYVVRLPGGIRDLLGNEREDPVEVVFSTGPEPTETRVSGRIRDRVTGQPVSDARVLFLSEEGDSIPYTAVSESEGEFSLRAMPPGQYTVHAFLDLNADLGLDRRLEPHDSTTIRLEDASASVETSFRLVPPDSTPPRLVRAEASDSLAVLLVLDDPLDPEQDLEAADVAVRPVDDGEDALPVEALGLGRRPAGPDEEAGAGAGAADTVRLPSDSLYVRLGRTLVPGRTYRASAAGLLNLRGLAGGGDTTFVYTPSDTAAAPDSAGAPPPAGTAAEGSAAWGCTITGCV